MDADVRRWRADTPAVDAGRIHLNNAGAALMPRPVVDAISAHLKLECELGGYEAAEARAPDITQSYESVARLVGAAPRNIAVVENATAAFAQALSAFDFVSGDVLLTTRNDYISNQLTYLSLARRCGLEIVRAEDLDGSVDLDSMRDLLRSRRPRIVAVTWMPTNSGLIQPVHDIGALCAEADVP